MEASPTRHSVFAPAPSNGSSQDQPVTIDVDRLAFFYGDKCALEDISIQLRSRVVTAFIGPSGCGKSTFLRTLNRMNDVIPGSRVTGRVSFAGRDIYGSDVVSQDLAAAARLLREDDIVDALKDQMFRVLLSYMLGDPRTIQPAIDLILISRHLERVSDHATNIAEGVIFIVEARDVRHHAADGILQSEQRRYEPQVETACRWC